MKRLMDYSTINIEALKRLPTYTVPPTYHLQKDSGNGCAGDAPGYPTYFTRSVYTQYGNTPRKGAQMVITHERVHYVVESHKDWTGCANWDAYYAKIQRRLRRLWNPLPLDHERTRCWIRETYRHHAHCYADVERPENGRPGTLICPVPGYKLKSFIDDPRWSDVYRETVKQEVEAFNTFERERADRIAIAENHSAVQIIRKFYPEYSPDSDLDLIDNPPAQVGGHWWETLAERPKPEECRPRSIGSHPINGNWCQWCGWHADE